VPIRVGAWNRGKSAAVMTYLRDSGTAPGNHFAAGLEEYQGRTPEDAATTEIAVQNAVRTIGELMQEDRKRREREGLPDLVLPDDLVAERPAPGLRARRAGRSARIGTAMARLRAWRPRPVHGAWAAAFAAVLIWPRVVLIALFAGFVVCLAGVALFGPEILERLRDRVMRLVGRPGKGTRAAGVDRRDPDEDEMPEPDPAPFEQRLRDLRG